jgi:HK97 family phage major capsid protein
MNRLEQLQQDRKAASDKYKKIVDENPDGISAEVKKKLDEIQKEIDNLDSEIEIHLQNKKNQENQKKLDENLRQPVGDRHIPGPPAKDGLSDGEEKDLNNYRLMNVLMAAMGRGEVDGLEREMHQEALNQARADQVDYQSGSIVIPNVVLEHGSKYFRNDMTTSDGAGGERIATGLRPVIDVLLDSLNVRALGATVLTGLRGDVDFPVMTAGSEPTEKSETGAADEITATTSKKSISPKRLPGYIEVTEKLLRQDAYSIEAWIRRHLGELTALRMERMAINGSGSSEQPTGLLNASGLTLVSHGTDGGAPARTTVTRLPGNVDVANALMGSLGYLTNGKVETTLKETKVDAGSGQFVWPEGGTTLNGYRAATSNVVPSNLTKGSGTSLSAMIFGNWKDLIIGQWGGIEIMPNPYLKMGQGITQIHIAAFYDILVARAASFAAAKDLVTVI